MDSLTRAPFAESGRIRAGYAEVVRCESFGGQWSRGFVFPAIKRTRPVSPPATTAPRTAAAARVR
jgi:hypothetical protein